MYKVYNAVIKEHGETAASYVVVDTETQEMVCAGETDISNKKRNRVHRLNAMQESLAHAVITVESGSTLSVYDHQIPDASLIFGRLRDEIITLIKNKNLSIEFNSTISSLHDIAHGLMCMSQDFSEPFSTAISNTEYEIQNPVHLFTDGSYDNHNENGDTAIGYALVDDSWTLIGLGSHSIPPAHSSLEAEYKAVRAGLNKSKKYNSVTEIQVLTDNQRVFRTLNGELDPLPRNKNLITEIESTYSSFDILEVIKTHRQENRLADALAGYGHESTIVGAL